MPCLSFKSIVQGFAWACAHQLRNEFHWDLYCTDQVLHLDYANEFFAQSQIEPNEKFKYARPTSLRQVSLAFITLPRQLINLVSSPVSYANLPDFQRQAILDAFVVQADAEWNGPGHVQQGLTEDGLPALMKVIAVDILRTHQTLATVRRCRSDGGGIAGRRPATLRTCVLHRVLQQTKEKKMRHKISTSLSALWQRRQTFCEFQRRRHSDGGSQSAGDCDSESSNAWLEQLHLIYSSHTTDKSTWCAYAIHTSWWPPRGATVAHLLMIHRSMTTGKISLHSFITVTMKMTDWRLAHCGQHFAVHPLSVRPVISVP